jgi:integrase
MAKSKKYPKNLTKIGNTYYIRYMENGKPIKKSLNTTVEREAVKKRNVLLRSVRDVKVETDVIIKIARAKKLYTSKAFSINATWSKFNKDLERNGTTDDTKKRHYHKWNNFELWLNNKHTEIINLNQISKDIAKEYADILISSSISNKVYNETIGLLCRVLEYFKEDADISINPFNKSIIARRPKNPISRKEFSEQETLTLLKSIPNFNIKHKNEYEVLFHIGTWSGLRLKDVCLLKWEYVNFHTNNIYIIPAKTKKYATRVKIPIHPILYQHLNRALSWQTNDYVLPNIAKKYNHNDKAVGKVITKILTENGFKNEITENTTKKVAPCIYGFHSLRYTFVAACAKNGVPLAMVQEIVGHTNTAMTKHYTRFAENHRQNAIQTLTLVADNNCDNKRQEIISLLNNATESKLSEILNLLIL